MRLLTGYTFYLVFWGLLGREPGYSSRRRRGVGVKTLGGSAIPCKGITTREAGEQSLISSDKRERTVCTGKGSLANSSGPGGQLHGLLPQANRPTAAGATYLVPPHMTLGAMAADPLLPLSLFLLWPTSFHNHGQKEILGKSGFSLAK